MNAPLTPPQLTMENAKDERHLSVTGGLKTVSYAKDYQGRVEMVEGDGWQPINDVNGQAWREIEKQIDRARAQVASGRTSCLYYYMVANQMSILLLARYSRQSPLKVFLHLIPFFFKRLQIVETQKYADLFQVAPEDLIRGDLRPAVYQLASSHGQERSS